MVGVNFMMCRKGPRLIVWSVNDGFSGNLLETSGNRPQRFLAGFRRFPAGFKRFPDNPSLTDHTAARKYETFVYFTKIKVATLSINKIIPVSMALAMPQVEESQKKSSKDHNNEEKVGPNRRFFFTSPLDSLFGKVHKE